MSDIITENYYIQAQNIPNTRKFSRNAYNTHLKSRKWKLLRQQRLEKDNYKCVVCDYTDSLQMHHLNYENFGNETIEDIITLCEICHKDAHTIGELTDD